jgi:hypothetical protein
MGTIAEDAQALIELSGTVEPELRAPVETVSEKVDELFDSVLAIIGNMHDPLITSIKMHVSYTHSLCEDLDKALADMQKLIKAKGRMLQHIGRTL